jgi:hypothetical protein
MPSDPWKIVRSASPDRKRRWGNLLSSKLRTMQKGLLLAINPIIFSNVLVQSPSSELFLLLREPSRSSWEIGDDEECEESNENLLKLIFKSVAGNEKTYSHCSLNDEEPSPSRETLCSVEPVGDSSSYETGEGTRE